GRKRATVWTTGMPEFPSSYNREEIDSVQKAMPADPAAFSPPSSTVTPVVWTGGRGTLELPFHYRWGSVWVTLSINGAPPAEFILDTGAFNTAIDRAYAQTIGLVSEGEHVAEGVGGYDTFGFSPIRSLRWQGAPGHSVEIRDLRAGVIQLQEGLSSVEWGRT